MILYLINLQMEGGKKEILENFQIFRKLEILQEEIYKIKINNTENFIDKAEEFKSIYETLKDIKWIEKKFWHFYNQLIIELEKSQNDILKITKQQKSIKEQLEKVLKKTLKSWKKRFTEEINCLIIIYSIACFRMCRNTNSAAGSLSGSLADTYTPSNFHVSGTFSTADLPFLRRNRSRSFFSGWW